WSVEKNNSCKLVKLSVLPISTTIVGYEFPDELTACEGRS
ncbi:17504_t:CDS:1, partial [Dentiscutata erythropus]